MDFEWDPEKDAKNLKKHRVNFSQAMMIFNDPSILTLFDEDHSFPEEDRFISLGRGVQG